MLQCLGRERPPLSLTTVELGVQLHCEGCERKIRETLYRMDGVDSVDVDSELQKVTVSGYVEPRKVLKAVRRTGTMAEYWPFATDSEHYAYDPSYLEHQPSLQTSAYTSYNQEYYQHGLMGRSNISNLDDVHAAPSVVIDDGAATMFSDDNVHACSIM